MRVVVLGLGSIGRRRVSTLRSLGCEEILVCRRPESARDGSDEALEVVYDLDQALARRPDAAIIATPTALHLGAATRCVEAGCHVLVEKPLAGSADGVDRLEALARRRGVIVAVAYNLRFHPVLRRARQLVGEGALGRIFAARAWVGQYLPDWHPGEDYRTGYVARSDLGGGVLLTLSHEVDYLCWLLGRVARVSAVTSRDADLDMETESLAALILEFAGGAAGEVHLDCLRRHPVRGFELLGTSGEAVGDLLTSRLEVRRAGRAEPDTERFGTGTAETYQDEVAAFLRSVADGSPPAVTIEEARAVLEVVLAARRSAVTGLRQHVG